MSHSSVIGKERYGLSKASAARSTRRRASLVCRTLSNAVMKAGQKATQLYCVYVREGESAQEAILRHPKFEAALTYAREQESRNKRRRR